MLPQSFQQGIEPCGHLDIRCPILDILLFKELNSDENFCKYILDDQTLGEKLWHQYIDFR